MLARLRPRLTYANVVSTLCLFVVLGGSSYAAVQLSRNSVKSKHIGRGQVKRSDLARNSVDSRKVRDGGLLAEDFAAGQLPAGTQGPPGERGEAGPPGTPATTLIASVKVASDNCTLDHGSGVVEVTVSSGSTGVCDVRFNRDVTDCTPVATLQIIGTTDGGSYAPRAHTKGDETATTQIPSADANEVRVATYEGTSLARRPFHLAVFC